MFVVSTVSDVKTLPTCIAYKALKATTQNVTWVLGARGRSGEVRHSPLPEFLLFFLRVHLLLTCAQCFLNEGYLKVKCCTVEKLMPKQVGNQNSKSFLRRGIFGSFSKLSLLCSLVITYFGEAVLRPLPVVPGETASYAPVNYATENVTFWQYPPSMRSGLNATVGCPSASLSVCNTIRLPHAAEHKFVFSRATLLCSLDLAQPSSELGLGSHRIYFVGFMEKCLSNRCPRPNRIGFPKN